LLAGENQRPKHNFKESMKNAVKHNPEIVIQQKIGQRIQELRAASGIKALALAERGGISQGQLSKIENGKATISIKTLSRLCEILNRPLSYLFQSEEEFPRVLGALNTVEGPERRGVEWFAQEVRRRTGGRISLIPLKVSQLGGAEHQVDRLREGVIDLFIEGLTWYHRIVPEFNIFDLPYTFRDNSHRQSFLQSCFFGRKFQEPLLAAGIRFLNPRWNWYRGLDWVLIARRPILLPIELRGLRIRIYESQLLERFWEAMGAVPVIVPWPEVKRALRDGRIDVLPTHKAHLFPLGFCQHASYVSLLGDLSPLMGVAMNEVKYQLLQPDIQNTLKEICDRSGDHFSAYVRRAEEENERLNIEKYRASYITVDISQWRVEVAKVRKELVCRGDISQETWLAVENAAGR
jgi:TRAP-type transport system periplasmic protein